MVKILQSPIYARFHCNHLVKVLVIALLYIHFYSISGDIHGCAGGVVVKLFFFVAAGTQMRRGWNKQQHQTKQIKQRHIHSIGDKELHKGMVQMKGYRKWG